MSALVTNIRNVKHNEAANIQQRNGHTGRSDDNKILRKAYLVSYVEAHKLKNHELVSYRPMQNCKRTPITARHARAN
jgi:hypothetical protein